MTKILHIITRLDRGGSSEDLLYNCIYFQNSRYISKIIYGQTSLPSTELINKAQVHNTVFFNVSQLRRSINPFLDLIAFFKIFRIIRAEKPDILHTHTSKSGIIGRWAGWLYNVTYNKHTIILHSTNGHVFYGYYNLIISFIFRISEKITALITDRIIVLTNNEITEHLEYGVGKTSIFSVVHSGIEYEMNQQNKDLRKELGFLEDDFIIGSVGRLDPVKGYINLIKAAVEIEKKINKVNIKFLIVGDGDQKETLENEVIDRNMQRYFVFTGWRKDVGQCISITNLYIQPSLNEGMGKTILYAQLSGKPIIASRVQGIVSLITHMETGILVSPGSPKEIASNILLIINNPELGHTLGTNAKKRLMKKDSKTNFYKYSIENMNYLIENIYSELLNKLI